MEGGDEYFEIHLQLPFREKGNQHDEKTFMDYCSDSGASRSVIGSNEESSYMVLTSHPPNLLDFTTVYKFGPTFATSSGITQLQMPLPDVQVLYFSANIIEGDIPLLVGLDVMLHNELILEFLANILR